MRRDKGVRDNRMEEGQGKGQLGGGVQWKRDKGGGTRQGTGGGRGAGKEGHQRGRKEGGNTLRKEKVYNLN